MIDGNLMQEIRDAAAQGKTSLHGVVCVSEYFRTKYMGDWEKSISSEEAGKENAK